MKKVETALAATLALLPASASAAWYEAKSPNFVIYSDDDPETVRTFAVKLESFDAALRRSRDIVEQSPIPSQRLTVYVLRNIDAVEALLHRSNVAGFYIPRQSGSVAFVPRTGRDRNRESLSAEHVLLHEYAHHFMYRTWGAAAFPAWLVEGFAEFNATANVAPDKVVLGAPPLYRGYGLLQRDLVPMRALLTGRPRAANESQTFYGRAWALTHYLTFEPQMKTPFAAYIDALGQGKDQQAAISILGDPGALDSALNRYVMRRRLSVITIDVREAVTGDVTVRPLQPGEGAMMPVRIRSQRGVDAAAAARLVPEARRIAATYPADAAVQVELAEAEFDARNYKEADAAAARALAADPAMIRAMIYRGLAQQRIALAAGNDEAATWKTIRGWFIQANKADPDDPWPLSAFYYSFAAPTANARKGLLYAQQLAPYDRSLTMEAARVHLDAGNAAPATTLLQRIAYDPHGGGMSALATATLATLNAKGAKEAGAQLAAARTIKDEDD